MEVLRSIFMGFCYVAGILVMITITLALIGALFAMNKKNKR